jgi:hypothetical protein
VGDAVAGAGVGVKVETGRGPAVSLSVGSGVGVAAEGRTTGFPMTKMAAMMTMIRAAATTLRL